MDDFIAYALTFSRVRGLGTKKLVEYRDELAKLNDEKDAWMLLQTIQAKYSRWIRVLPSLDSFKLWLESTRYILDKQKNLGIGSVTFKDKAYPIGFRSVHQPPLYFFYKGNLSAFANKSIAIIGTRNVTPYTEKIGHRMGEYAAENGWNVVSGLALGSDAAGHAGCLAGKGVTIAIVGTSLDKIYPRQNAALEKEILEKDGLVLSEYPLGALYSPSHFVERDRLQSGLANGVFVAATGETGGTWHAIHEASYVKKPLAFWDYRHDGHYDFRNDSHTWGMSKMEALGATPLGTKADVDGFFLRCRVRFMKERSL